MKRFYFATVIFFGWFIASCLKGALQTSVIHPKLSRGPPDPCTITTTQLMGHGKWAPFKPKRET